MRRFFSFCILLIMAACGTTDPAEKEQVTDTSAQATSAAPAPIQRTLPDQLNALDNLPEALADLIYFPLHWELLTPTQGVDVVYLPCDQENSSIFIEQEEETFKVQVREGNAETIYTLQALQLDLEDYKNGGSYQYKLQLQAAATSAKKEVVVFMSDEPSYALWEGLKPTLEGSKFVPLEFSMHYPLVSQPCLECYDDPCENERYFYEGYGIGVTKVNTQKDFQLEFYDAPNGKRLHQVNVVDGKYTNEAALEGWYVPQTNVLEYDLLDFVCNKQVDGFYRVEHNNETGEYMWLKASPAITFYTYEEYLPLAFAVSRHDPLHNPIKMFPGQNGSIINYELETDCFSPKKVIGKWLQVVYEPLMCDKETGPAPFKTGWIKWRDSQGLILQIFWAN